MTTHGFAKLELFLKVLEAKGKRGVEQTVAFFGN